MPATAPERLSVRHAEQSHDLLASGQPLPTRKRVMMALQKAGQNQLEFALFEGAGQLVTEVRLDLPRGLPANCWIAVFFDVGRDGRVRVEGKENLRRISVDGVFDNSGRSAVFFDV